MVSVLADIGYGASERDARLWSESAPCDVLSVAFPGAGPAGARPADAYKSVRIRHLVESLRTRRSGKTMVERILQLMGVGEPLVAWVQQ